MILAIKANALDNLSNKKRRVFDFVADRVDLGTPALYEQPNGTSWYAFSDPEVGWRDVAAVVALASVLRSWPPAGWELPVVIVRDEDGNEVGQRIDKPALRAEIVAAVRDAIEPLPDDTDPAVFYGRPWLRFDLDGLTAVEVAA